MTRVLTDLATTPAILARLLRGDGVDGVAVDASLDGVLRSFAWPLLALVPAVISFGPILDAAARGAASSSVASAEVAAEASRGAELWQVGLGHLIYTFGFPLVLAVMVARLGGGQGFGLFTVLFNGMRFWLAMVYAAVALAAVAGAPPLAVVFAWTTVAGVSLFMIWRIARETLTGEWAFSAAVVLLAMGCDVGGDYLAGWLVSVFG